MQKFLLYPKKKAIILPRSFEPPAGVVFKEVEYRGKVVRVVQHSLENTLKLRELGFEIPSPIRFWDWPKVKNKFDPFSHQIDGGEFLTFNKRAHLLLPLGTGKSYTSAATAAWLVNQGIVKKVGVLCPLSCMRPVWQQELFQSLLPTDVTSVVVYGTAEKRKELLSIESDFYISNHALLQVAIEKATDQHGNVTYRVKKGFEAILDIDLWIFDEQSVLRNADTHLWNAMNLLLSNKSVRYWGLTGFPTPGGPTDGWAQSRLVNPENTPKYFGAFRRQVCNEVKNGQFSKWVPKVGADKTVFELMQPAFTVDKSVVNLPPLTVVRREVELSKVQQDLYKKMLREMVMLHDENEVTAQSAADRCLKLRQICLGAIKVGDKDYMDIDADNNPRLKTILEIIDESPNKSLVISPFTGGLRLVAEYFRKHKITCEFIDGSVPEEKRTDIINRFQTAKDPRVLLAQEASISHGVTCTAADKIVFLGPTVSNDRLQQLLGRIWRISQENPTTAYFLYANSLEKRLWDVVEDRQEFQDSVMNIYRDELKNA